MITLRALILAALQSLSRGKTFLQALLALWISPALLKAGTANDAPGSSSSSTTTTTSSSSSSSSPRPDRTSSPSPQPPGESEPEPEPRRRSPDDFLREAEALFLGPIEGGGDDHDDEDAPLARFARRLGAQFAEGLLRDPACMLPSYNHQLPSRRERGRYLALDVGGSTLRIALVELRGGRGLAGDGEVEEEQEKGEKGDEESSSSSSSSSSSRILRLESFRIEREVKSLEGMAFFDWMARRIVDTVAKEALDVDHGPEKPLLMGLAWSFPIEQTSPRSGRLQGMGKGFLASDGLVGQDLGAIIASACAARGLAVELAAIVNDSTAALLSGAYAAGPTRFSLILGTGVNIAVHLPVRAVGRHKFGGDRPPGWSGDGDSDDSNPSCYYTHVVVNTELGMFGRGILPLTRWDRALNAAHLRPDFQPLEHLVSGCYLGEVCRLALLEAIRTTTGVFGGVVPPSLLLPYSLDTELMSRIEGDSSPSLSPSLALFRAAHPSPAADATTADMAFLRTLASFISRRSSALVAASLFALWRLKNDAEARLAVTTTTTTTTTTPSSLSSSSAAAAASRAELALDGRHVVAFNGSVIEHYPRYLENCQAFLDSLVLGDSLSSSSEEAGAGKRRPGGTIRLVGAKESSLLGAAVALACSEEEEGKAS